MELTKNIIGVTQIKIEINQRKSSENVLAVLQNKLKVIRVKKNKLRKQNKSQIGQKRKR